MGCPQSKKRSNTIFGQTSQSPNVSSHPQYYQALQNTQANPVNHGPDLTKLAYFNDWLLSGNYTASRSQLEAFLEQEYIFFKSFNLIMDYPKSFAVSQNKEINREWERIWMEYFKTENNEYIKTHLKNTWKFCLHFNAPLPTPPIHNPNDYSIWLWENA